MQVGPVPVTPAATSGAMAGRPAVVAGSPNVMAGRSAVMAGLDPAIYAATGAAITGGATPAPDISAAQLAKMRQGAQDFEAMALGQLLAPMFDTVDTAHSAFGGGEAEATIKPLLIDAIAKHIAAHGGLGLAAPVFASMLRTQEAANAAGPGGRATIGRPR